MLPELSSSEISRLLAGGEVRKQVGDGSGGGTAMSVFEVEIGEASDTEHDKKSSSHERSTKLNFGGDVGWVLGTIMDYINYVNMVPKTTVSTVYTHSMDTATYNENVRRLISTGLWDARETHIKGLNSSMTVYPISPFPPSLTFHVSHDISLKRSPSTDLITEGIITWTLDYSKRSEVKDSLGFWYVTLVSPTRVRVYYSVRMAVFDWVPRKVVDVIRGKALEEATTWVAEWSGINGRERERERERARERGGDGDGDGYGGGDGDNVGSWEHCLSSHVGAGVGVGVKEKEIKKGVLKRIGGLLESASPAIQVDDVLDGMDDKDRCYVEVIDQMKRYWKRADDTCGEVGGGIGVGGFGDFTILRRFFMVGVIGMQICVTIYLAAWRKKALRK